MRDAALSLAHGQLVVARNEVFVEKARVAERSGLLKNLTSKAKHERELLAIQGQLIHYESQLKKAESLASLIQKDISRWLECSLKTDAPEFAAALATHAWPADWGRFSYGFELLVKSFRMGLQDIVPVFRRESLNGVRSPLLQDSIRKLLPVARQIEIDVEFFNRILSQRENQRSAGAAAQLHPEYNWCDAVEQLRVLPLEAAQDTLRELLDGCAGFLAIVGQAIKREPFQAEARGGRGEAAAPANFLEAALGTLRESALQWVNPQNLGTIITETESLLMDGEFTARFNRHLVQSITPAQAGGAPRAAAGVAAPAAAITDAELLELKAKLRAELEEAAKARDGFAARERAVLEREQAVENLEKAFAKKCAREQAALDEARAKLAESEAAIAEKDREAEAKRVELMARLDEMQAEADARSQFLEESEQRLLAKGQEQLEALAEIEQREEELMATRRELNAIRKEIGLPLVALRAQPVDEFLE